MTETAIDVSLVDLTTSVEVTDLAIDVEITEPTIQVTHDEVAVEVQHAGPAGPAGQDGVDGVGAALETNFAYGDATPKTIVAVAAGKFIYQVDLLITEAFNGAGASLQVGDIGMANRLMSAAENDPSTLGTYSTHPNVAYIGSTDVLLTIIPGAGASSGTGILRLLIQQ